MGVHEILFYVECVVFLSKLILLFLPDTVDAASS